MYIKSENLDIFIVIVLSSMVIVKKQAGNEIVPYVKPEAFRLLLKK